MPMNKILFSLLLSMSVPTLAMNDGIPEAWSFIVRVSETVLPAGRVFAQCKHVYDAPDKRSTRIDAYLNERANILRIEIFDSREAIIRKLKSMPWFSEKTLYQFGSSAGIY